MSRLSLRARLTLAFAIAMAIVVSGLALFVYRMVEGSLTQSIDQGLRARAVDVANLADQAENGLSSARNPLAGPEQSFGQLIDGTGRIYDQTPGLAKRPLLTAAQLARARHRASFVDLASIPGGGSLPGGPARIFVEPIHAQDQALVLLVGTSLADQHGATAGLRTGLLIGGPVALLLAALGGYLLAGAALRPVERMRARAAGVSPQSTGERLPVPRADDEIGRLGRTLNEMLAGLEQARERERQFLADASHELRTPLALLKTEIELALDGPHAADQLVSSLRSARKETDRVVQLAEDLLLLAQADNGALPVRITSINASELGGRITARFAHRAGSEGREIETEAPHGLMLPVDPLRIEQALANLVDNSLRYGAGTITLQIVSHDDDVELHVRDQGAGITPELRAYAFERFARDDPVRHDQGAGLGLAIVLAIAQAHGGEALLGNGADVFLRLPGCAAPTPTGGSGGPAISSKPADERTSVCPA
jgi:signal transduction histidine kinase